MNFAFKNKNKSENPHLELLNNLQIINSKEINSKCNKNILFWSNT